MLTNKFSKTIITAFAICIMLYVSIMLIELIQYRSNAYMVTNMQELKDELNKNITEYNTDFSIFYKSDEGLTKVELDNIFSDIMSDLYLKNTIESWEYSVSGLSKKLNIDLTIKYRITKEQNIELDIKIAEILNNILTDNMSTFEKVKSIHDYIVLNSEYSLDTINSPYSPYTIISEGKGVCSAYALLTHKMLSKANVESYIVEGETTEPHAWNIVKINNDYYHLDTTWDDPLEDRKGLVQYTYFLATDDYMAKDHTWDKANYPKALSNNYAWMHDLRDTTSIGNKITYISNGKSKTLTYTSEPDTIPPHSNNTIVEEISQSKNNDISNFNYKNLYSKILQYFRNILKL